MAPRWLFFVIQLCAATLAMPVEAQPAPKEVTRTILAQVAHAPVRATDVAGVLPDSLKLKMLAALARGDIAGAITLWQAHNGVQTVPKALQAFQAAFSTANRIAGPCARVAKDIYEGFNFFGGQTQYVRISSTGGNYLSWQSRILMSDNNSHIAVRYGAKLYDAFTGPAGMLEAEYLRQIHYAGEIVLKTVTSS
jgi:hypothetical protein